MARLEALRIAAYTAIRAEVEVEQLMMMSQVLGADTPVSGDALIQRKADLVKAGR